jgi:orotidine-5'-phosphate decarboxylase
LECFADRLAAAVDRCGNPVLVGLDPRADMLPDSLRPEGAAPSLTALAAAFYEFGRGVIDAVAALVPAIKPQAAFFEELGPAGMEVLAALIRYGQEKGLLVVLDGKRNDIGTTAAAYARGILGRESAWGADALTVSPYLGDDSLTPFVEVAQQRGCGVFVLVKTSNPGGRMLQDLESDGRPLYRHVAEFVQGLAAKTAGACGYGAVGAVVGATYPEQLVELRQAMPNTWFLVPGYGAQGGAAKDVVAALDGRGRGAIVNNSRGIIFAYRNKPYADQFGAARWQEAVAAATRRMIGELTGEQGIKRGDAQSQRKEDR